jgi:uncharacterized protein YlxW (UPF0749 family)
MRRPESAWRLLVPVTFLGAGLLFAASHETARGTDLRGGRIVQLGDLITDRQAGVAELEQRAAALRADVDTRGAALAERSTAVQAEVERAARLAGPVGLEAVSGPGLVVTLDDAPRRAEGREPVSDNPDDLVVHQEDVQSVLNGLWAGGAEAVTVMGDRIISTSAVRCVGNTLLVHGRLVGPPFVIRAVGDVRGMRAALALEPGVALFRQYVDAYGLTYDVRAQELALPAYDGSLALPHVRRG